MACSHCGNTYTNCTCGTPIYSYNWLTTESYPCNPCSTTNVCKIRVPGQCVFYNGPNLTCLGLTTGVNYDLVIAAIHTAICQLQECCQGCEPIVVSDVLPPDAPVETVYNFAIPFTGTAPVTLSNLVITGDGPTDWLTVQIVGSEVVFSGTVPAIQALNYTVTFTLTNPCTTSNLSYSFITVNE